MNINSLFSVDLNLNIYIHKTGLCCTFFCASCKNFTIRHSTKDSSFGLTSVRSISWADADPERSKESISKNCVDQYNTHTAWYVVNPHEIPASCVWRHRLVPPYQRPPLLVTAFLCSRRHPHHWQNPQLQRHQRHPCRWSGPAVNISNSQYMQLNIF